MSDTKLDAISVQLEALVKALTPKETKEPEKKKEPEVLDMTDLSVIDEQIRKDALVKMQAKFHIGDAVKQDLSGYREALVKMQDAEKPPLVKSARTTDGEDGKPAPADKGYDRKALAKSFFGKPQETK